MKHYHMTNQALEQIWQLAYDQGGETPYIDKETRRALMAHRAEQDRQAKMAAGGMSVLFNDFDEETWKEIFFDRTRKACEALDFDLVAAIQEDARELRIMDDATDAMMSMS